MEYQYDVFISYSRKDYVDENNNEIPGNPISKLKEHLKNANVSYWFDKEGIIHGDQFASVIVKNIKQSRILLFVSSEHSNLSEWTCDEIATARTYKRKIIPFRIDESEYNETVMLYLAKLDFIDYTNNPTQSLEELVKSIQKYKLDLAKKEQDEANRQKKIQESAQIETIKSETLTLAKNARRAIQIQLSALGKIHKKLKGIGIVEKTCPVCQTPVLIEQRFCDCCGFFFPLFYGIGMADQEKEVDPTYYAIMKGLWMSFSPETKEETHPSCIKEENVIKTNKPKKEKGVYCVENVKFKMIPVEGGSFTMGNKEHAHKVSLSSYKIGETPVTQELWQAVMGDNPSKYKGENRPIEQVSWEDCQKFIKKLNQITGKMFRLPTEAEWEFAARGGNRSLKTIYSGGMNLDDVAWYNMNCSENEDSGLNFGTHDVKAKAPNELRIYDMSGNVWEWCSDWFAEYPHQHESNPVGPNTGQGKVCRGGSWNSDSMCCEVKYRNYGGVLKRDSSYGLRLAL